MIRWDKRTRRYAATMKFCRDGSWLFWFTAVTATIIIGVLVYAGLI